MQTNDEKILSLLQNIMQKISVLEEKIDAIDKKCSKMTSHVDFVDGIYEDIKKPFHFALNKVKLLQNNSDSVQFDHKMLYNSS